LQRFQPESIKYFFDNKYGLPVKIMQNRQTILIGI
jgi:hypothetical protein